MPTPPTPPTPSRGGRGEGEGRPGPPAAPVPRSRSGLLGRRHPRTGTEPATAHSALELRQLLSVIFVPLFALVTVALALWWAGSTAADDPSRNELGALALACGALTVLGALDWLVIRRRLRRERGGHR